MHYTVKRTFRPPLSTDDPQWQQANVLELKNYMGEKPSHFPKTQARLLYDNQNLYVFFKVQDQYVRAVAEELHGKVWQDSCVEFFFTPHAELENIYFNLETNCGGTMLFRYNNRNSDTEKYVEASDCEKMGLTHSLPKIITDEIHEPVTWTLSYRIPFDVIARYSEMTTPHASVKWKANFYKCADKTSHPHWLTWAHIDNPTPNFICPNFSPCWNSNRSRFPDLYRPVSLLTLTCNPTKV